MSAAHGVGQGAMAECFCYRVDLGQAGFQTALGGALKRDFLGGEGELVSPAMAGPGGSA